jgi:LacI family transcriptional regulator
MTVSNVVNGRHNSMTEETRLRVEASINTLGYVPNVGARTVRLRRSYAFGLLVIEASPLYLADPFISQCAAGLSNRFNAAGYKLMVQGSDPGTYNNSLYFKDISVDGLCVMLPGSRNTRKRKLADISSLKLPTVFLQETLTPDKDNWCSIGFDQSSAASFMWSVLSERSLSHLVFLEPDSTWPAIEARHSKMAKLARQRFPDCRIEVLHCGEGSFSSTKEKLLSVGSTLRPGLAIVASNDRMGVAAIHAIQQLHLSIPEDVSIIGFHDFEFRQFARPQLTTVRTSPYDLGATAAEALLRWDELGRFNDSRVVLPVKLLRGETT